MSTQFRPEQANLAKYWDFGSGTMRVPAGTSFPADPNDGDMFYRTDEDLLYIYDGAGWARIQNQALDVAVEQIGAPTYENVQDWINTTQSAGLISGGTITATSYAIAEADDVAETFKIAGDVTAYFTNGVVFAVSGSTGNDGDYTTVGDATYHAGNDETTITVADVPDGTNDGDIADGRVDVALGTGMIKKTDDEIDGVTTFSDWPATANILLVDNDVNWLYTTYGAGTPAVAATNDYTTIDFTTEFIIGRVYREGAVLHILNSGTHIYNAFRRMHRRIRNLRRVERAEGAIITNEGTLKIKVTAAVLYSGVDRLTTAEVDTSGAGRFRAWYHGGGGNWTSTGHPPDQRNINSAQYDTGAGLAALDNHRYGVYWVFLDFDSHIHVVYGTTSYKLHEAEAAEVPAAIPPICSEFSVLVGRIIAFKDDMEITEAASAFVTMFHVVTPANYQDLANRGHDLIGVDHQDTLADTVVDGDVIIGNVTPKWSRLAIAVPAADVRNVLGIDNGETRPSWKTALDGVNPANIAAAADPGTSLIFSHRDHVHAHPAGLGVNLHHTQQHDIVGGDHMVTGAIWSVVGCAAADAVGLMLARDDVTAPVESILKSTAAGGLTLVDLTLTNDLLLADGAVIGITGNEVITFDALGNITITGANVGVGTTDMEAWDATFDAIQLGGTAAFMATDPPAAADQFLYLIQNAYYDGDWRYRVADGASMYVQSGGGHYFYTIASGVPDAVFVWGGSKLYVDVAGQVTVVQGLNVGTGTQATIAGHIHAEVSDTGLAFNSDFDKWIFEDNSANGANLVIATKNDAAGALAFADGDARNKGQVRYDHAAEEMQFYAGGGVAGLIDAAQDWYRTDDDAEWSQVSDEQFKRDITPVSEALASLQLLEPIHFRYRAKYHEINPVSDLRRLRTGFTAQNFAKVFPEQVKQTSGYKSMNTSGLTALLAAGVQQLNGHRLGADAEREAIRAEIVANTFANAKLQERLDRMERRR